MALTTSDLLKDVRQVAALPEVTAVTNEVIDQETEYTTDLGVLKVATRELQTYIAPKIMAQREEFFVARKSYTLSSANQKFRLPPRAIGSKIKYASVLSSGGSTESPWKELTASNVDDGYKNGYYLEGAYLKTRTDTTGTLYVAYYSRPSKLIPLSYAGVISGISGNVITVSTLPLTGVNNLTVGTANKVDIIKQSSPYEVCDSDLQITGTTSTTVTVSGTISTDWEVGDYLAMSETSPVAQIPQDLWNWLVQRTVVKILGSNGDTEGWKVAAKDLEDMEATVIPSITPRTENKRQVIKNKTLWGM